MTTTDPAPVEFNPLVDGFTADPYTHLGQVRESAPVQRFFDRWGLFAYQDCFALLRDPAMSVDENKSDIVDGMRRQQRARAAADVGVAAEPDRSLLSKDPPDHTRLRRLVTKAFTPRSIQALRPTVQGLVNDRLDTVAANRGGDLVAELAFPLPFDVISLMLGMPQADTEQIKAWSGAMVKELDPIISDDEVRSALAASVKMRRHIAEVIEWKRANPDDDLLTRLIEAEEDGDRLSTDELTTQIVLLFVAGHETTVNLIGTGLFELLRHPEQLDRWRHDEGLDSNAVDELLRYISPVQISRRIALVDVEFGGIEIPARSFLLAVLASANRDPDKFGPTAGQLDLGRADAGHHLAFGSGAHYCLGASLAKLEAEVALTSFIRRFPNAALGAEPSWNGRLNLRGLATLPLAV